MISRRPRPWFRDLLRGNGRGVNRQCGIQTRPHNPRALGVSFYVRFNHYPRLPVFRRCSCVRTWLRSLVAQWIQANGRVLHRCWVISVANMTVHTVLAVDGREVNEMTVGDALNSGNACTSIGSPCKHGRTHELRDPNGCHACGCICRRHRGDASASENKIERRVIETAHGVPRATQRC